MYPRFERVNPEPNGAALQECFVAVLHADSEAVVFSTAQDYRQRMHPHLALDDVLPWQIDPPVTDKQRVSFRQAEAMFMLFDETLQEGLPEGGIELDRQTIDRYHEIQTALGVVHDDEHKIIWEHYYAGLLVHRPSEDARRDLKQYEDRIEHAKQTAMRFGASRRSLFIAKTKATLLGRVLLG